MGGDMCLLLLFKAIDPDLTGIFLGGDLLVLLHELVEKLLSLDVILLLQRLPLNL